MSKGYTQRRNKKTPSPQPTSTSLAEDNLRELNKTLIGALKEKAVEISSLKESLDKLSIASSRDRSHAIECMESKDRTIGGMLDHNEYLSRKLEDMRHAYDDLKDSSRMVERNLMHTVCDMEGKLEVLTLEYARALTGWSKEKESLQDYIRQTCMARKKERAAWEEEKKALDDSVSRLQRSLEELQEEKGELSETLSILRRNNKVLARNYVKERDGNRRIDDDLDQARRTIQILFKALNTCRDDLTKEKKGHEVLRGTIASMEADFGSLKDENLVIKTKFDKLMESGAWTGVLLDRQEGIISHLKDSLAEERSRLKDANARVDKCLEQLAAERTQRDILNVDLRMSREKSARCSVELQEELRRNRNEIEETIRERNALEDVSVQTQGELELLRGRHEYLQAENESLRKGYSNLQQDMKWRMMRLKKGIGVIKSN